MIKYLGLSILVISMISCSPKMAADQNKSGSQDPLAYVNKAYKALGVEPVKFKLNQEEDYALATYLNKGQIPGDDPLKIAVIKLDDNTVVYNENVKNGSVKWVKPYLIEVIIPPGIPQGNQAKIEDYTYVVDVKTGKKTKKPKIVVND